MKSNNTDTRKDALAYWEELPNLTKVNLIDKYAYMIIGYPRDFKSLTGREIETIYKAEHPPVPTTVEEDKEVDLLEGITQGKWEVSGNLYGDEYSCVIIGGEHKGIIARTSYNPYINIDESEANARLIASAPLLASENKELRLLKNNFDAMLKVAKDKNDSLAEVNTVLLEALQWIEHHALQNGCDKESLKSVAKQAIQNNK